MVTKWIPDAGDLIWLNFDPTEGHEQRGSRPALVLSARHYNAQAKLALVCPLTKVVKNYPSEIPLQLGEIEGVLLADQIRSVAWEKRKAKLIGKVSIGTCAQVLNVVDLLCNRSSAPI